MGSSLFKDYFGRGLLANRPAPGALSIAAGVGAQYWATDTATMYELNLAGTGWQAISGGGGGGARSPVNLGVMPALSGFTPVNINSNTTLIENAGKAISVVDTGPSTNTTKVRGMYKASPATPFRVAMYCQYNAPSFNYGGVAFGVTDGTALKLVSTESANGIFASYAWTDANTRGSGGSTSIAFSGNMFSGWFAVRDDGTNVFFEVSADGAYYTVINSVAHAGSYDKVFIGLADLVYTSAIGQHSMSILTYDEAGLTRVAG